MKIFLVMNPSSRSGRGRRNWRPVFDALKAAGVEFGYGMTEKALDGTFLAERACAAGYDIVAAVGGDGTICEVVTGLIDPVTSKARGPKLGVLYSGTSPDFNKYHGLSLDMAGAVRVLLNGKSKLIDVGRVIHRGENKMGVEPRIDFFVGNVNIGIGAAVARQANSGNRKILGDVLGTLSGLVHSIGTYRPTDFTVRIDGQESTFSSLINMTIGKNPYIASGMRVMHDISDDDGRLYCLSVSGFSIPELMLNLPRLYLGDFLAHDKVSLSYCTRVDIDFNPQYPEIEFDGDPRGFLPASVEVVPGCLEVMCP